MTPPSSDTPGDEGAKHVVSLELLGRPRVVVRDTAGTSEMAPPRLQRAWLLLAIEGALGSRARDDVREMMWDAPDTKSAHDLNQVVSSARSVLGRAKKALISTGNISFDASKLPPDVRFRSDVREFQDLATRTDIGRALDAIRLFRGPLLEGCVLDRAGEDWVQAERERHLRQLRRLIDLVFADTDQEGREELVHACLIGTAAQVADLGEERRIDDRAPVRSTSALTARPAPIGVIAPVSAWPTAFYTNIIKGIRRAADEDDPERRRGIVVFDVAREDVQEVDEVLATALERDLPGLIALNATWGDNLRERMRKEGRRVVSVMFEDLAAPVCRSIVLDNSNFYGLMTHTMREPCEAAVLVSPPPFDRFERSAIDLARNDKREAYELAAGRARLVLSPVRSFGQARISAPYERGHAHVIEIPSYEADIGGVLFEQIAEQLPDDTAVVFLNDCQAASFLKACARSPRSAADRGLRVSAYEDTDAAKWFDLSTVDPQLDLVGRLAYQRLLEALDDPAFPYLTESVTGLLKIRRSTQDAADSGGSLG